MRIQSTKIKAENLNLFYGDKQALRNINLVIPAYKVTALIVRQDAANLLSSVC